MERFIRPVAFGRLGLFLLAAVLLIGLVALVTPSKADPIGGPNDIYGCANGTCQGAAYVLFYSGSPVSTTATTKTYDVTLLIDVSTLNVPSAVRIDNVAIKVSSGLTGSPLLLSAPGGPGNWSLFDGGINNGGCSGAGAGFECADSTSTSVATLPYNGSYFWTFQLEIPNSGGGIDTSDFGPSIKARYVDSNGVHVGDLVSEHITLQLCDTPDGCYPPQSIPEPATLLLLGSGLVALVRKRMV